MTHEALGIGLLLAAVTVESFAQLFLKRGATPSPTAASLPDQTLVASDSVGQPRQPRLPNWLARGSSRFWLSLGVAAYAFEIVLYTAALSQLDVSVAFPLGSLCFVGVALLAMFFLGERVERTRWVGVGFILAGAILVTR